MSEAKAQLLNVLREATSQDYVRMRQAEEMLKQWENAPSFFATLQVSVVYFFFSFFLQYFVTESL